MTTRILPVEEWPRLAGTELGSVWPMLDPKRAQIIVVEDAGRIVGTWALMWQMHVEGLWCHPDFRKGTAVGRRLLATMHEQAERAGAGAVITGAVSDEVRALLVKAGATKIPGDSYAIPVGRRFAKCRTLGRKVMQQLDAAQPEDPVHDAAIGQALLTALKDQEPEKAAIVYNAWARAAGRPPITVIPQAGGTLVVDIGTAIVEIDAAYRVTVLEAACQQQ